LESIAMRIDTAFALGCHKKLLEWPKGPDLEFTWPLHFSLEGVSGFHFAFAAIVFSSLPVYLSLSICISTRLADKMLN